MILNNSEETKNAMNVNSQKKSNMVKNAVSAVGGFMAGAAVGAASTTYASTPTTNKTQTEELASTAKVQTDSTLKTDVQADSEISNITENTSTTDPTIQINEEKVEVPNHEDALLATDEGIRVAQVNDDATFAEAFADACFSGGIRGSNVVSNSSAQDSDVLLFLSSRTGERSIESKFMSNGFYISYLIRGLRGGADYDKNRNITAKELFEFVSQGVKERSEDKQHPVMWGNFDDDYILMNW